MRSGTPRTDLRISVVSRFTSWRSAFDRKLKADFIRKVRRTGLMPQFLIRPSGHDCEAKQPLILLSEIPEPLLAFEVEIKGLGFSSCSAMYSSIVPQFRHALEHAAFQPVARQTAEEAFDRIEPGDGSVREVHMEARMLLQPCLHDGMLVGGIAVADQMQFLFLRRFSINLAQEVQPLGMAMRLRVARDDGAV